MSGVLLDTNVLSELVRPAPHRSVAAFVAQQPEAWLSVIVLHELSFGLALLPAGHRRDELERALSRTVGEYGDRVLAIGRREAVEAGRLRAETRRSGRILSISDSLIAATARVHALTVATRNTADFENLQVSITNPWRFGPAEATRVR